jgi:beta-glucosidase
MREDNVFSVPFSGELSLEGAMRPVSTVLDELRARFGDRVAYAPGCEVNGSSLQGLEEAVDLARSAEVAVMVMGDKAGLTADSTSGEGRDRPTLDLPGRQEDLVRAVIETGTPVVLVLVGGRPMGSEWAHEHSAAVIQAWLPGEEGAGAIADVLAGIVNPGGKLPVSHPRSAGQIPVYYAHKVSGGRSQWKGDYVDGPAGPLYPFGHGLSYTNFEIAGLSVAPAEVSWNDQVVVTVSVANRGDRDGDEVIQVYITDPVATVTRPVLELKAFARVHVEAGGARQLEFRIPVGQLGFYDAHLAYVVEPGSMEVLVGTSSRDVRQAGSFSVIPDPSRPVEKHFQGRWEVVQEPLAVD